MNHIKIIVTLLILSQSAHCMELATELEKIIKKTDTISPQFNKSDLLKLNAITNEVRNILFEQEQIKQKQAEQEQKTIKEIITISKRYSLTEMKAMMANAKGDLENAETLEQTSKTEKEKARKKRLAKIERRKKSRINAINISLDHNNNIACQDTLKEVLDHVQNGAILSINPQNGTLSYRLK